MCGIVGLIPFWKTSGFDGKQQDMVYQMLFADLLRGKDATGVVSVMKTGDFGIMKDAVDGYQFNGQFIDSEHDKQLYQEGVALIGHNRAKTIGENKEENAHPFVIDKTFAMVHNGTLRNHKQLADTVVDSEALAITFKKAMDEEDWKTALEKTLGQVEGAFACVWYDQKRDQVCMIRNKERPLGIVQTTRTTLFGSEIPLLQWVAMRNGDKVEKVLSLKEHTLYTFDMQKSGGDYSETFLSPITKTGGKTTSSTGYTNGTTITPGAKKAPVATDEPKEVSKNEFKRLRARLQGKMVPFYIEDAVEDTAANGGTPSKVLVTGYCLDGSHDLCEIRHYITCTIDLVKDGITVEDVDDATMFIGQVSCCDYNKEHKALQIILRNPTLKEFHDAKVVH